MREQDILTIRVHVGQLGELSQVHGQIPGSHCLIFVWKIPIHLITHSSFAMRSFLFVQLLMPFCYTINYFNYTCNNKNLL